MNKRPNEGEEKRDTAFLLLLISIVVLIMFTGINTVIFNWVFLGTVYNEPFNYWSFVTFDMLIAYLNWLPGKVLSVLNVAFGILPFVFWYVLKWSGETDEEELD